MASEKIQGLLDTIGALSVKEFIELSKALQHAFSVKLSDGPTQIPELEVAMVVIDDYDPYDVVIKDAGAQKIQVLKTMRELIPSLGLKEAKAIVDNAPSLVVQTESKWEAVEIKKKLDAVGATVEIKEVAR